MKEEQKKVRLVLEKITREVPYKEINYYGKIYDQYLNIDKYLNELDNPYDKIFVSQWCHNYDKVEELIKEVQLDDYAKEKYKNLKKINSEINETINFKILDKKYAFLDDLLDIITCDQIVQDEIISLNDSRLKIFQKLYKRINQLTDYPVPYIDIILQRIGYITLEDQENNSPIKEENYKELLSDIEKNEDKNYDIDKLLYILTSSITYNIKTYDDIDKINDDKLSQLAIKNKDKNLLKYLILKESYSVSLEYARRIIKKYDITCIENKEIKEIYKAISNVLNEDNPDKLIYLYKTLKQTKITKDTRRIITFETDLREEYGKYFNKKYYKLKGEYQVIDGIKIYEAKDEFNMLITSLGAYQGNFQAKENYSDYWNSDKIRSHANSSSIISNENLSMAKVRSVVLGFTNMNPNMLLLCSNHDLNTTPSSRDFNLVGSPQYLFPGFPGSHFTSINKLIDNTRSDHNEIVYERRDLSKNKEYYKKNPDYILYIEEYEDINKTKEKYKSNETILNYIKIQEINQNRNLKESIKAAKNFNIPIVKINREALAKQEYKKINNLLEEYKKTKDPTLIKKIITKFENNRYGNFGDHEIIQKNYFSKINMTKILNTIKEIIDKQDEPLRSTSYYYLYKVINEEQEKTNKNKKFQTKNQSSSINFKNELEDIKERLNYERKTNQKRKL